MLFVMMSVVSCKTTATSTAEKNIVRDIKEVNAGEITAGKKHIAIVGATIIDGNGGEPIANGIVLINGNTIEAAGSAGKIDIPNDAERIDAQGMYILPGFIDSHFHLDNMHGLPALFLQHGVTSVRDPGAWMEAYDGERASGKMIPRLFLAGPHLDAPNPAYPYDAYIVRDSLEAVNVVERQINQGASVIKVYFRLSPALIHNVCTAAHKHGIPVTAHLEITEAMEAIECGLDGVEHITSFGLSLQSKREGEKYRQMVWADNNARKQGRYDVWSRININSKMADSVAGYLVRKGTFVSPTLGAFEYQPEKNNVDSTKLIAFNNMKAFTGKLKKAGVKIVLGSHSNIEYAELGWAFQREMELQVQSGMSNMQVIIAATMENARYFRIDHKLGSIEKGKIADLVLLKENPLQDIKAAYHIARVMFNGNWVP
ncbi:MAG: amidohydrolase family protein [Chitinophagaceae bacterium]|nr:amidohydrolase family protein [Chitinophagaceae bacterium]